jgi:ubiquinone/menaquinone biosynthesis C-methylase UbiE
MMHMLGYGMHVTSLKRIQILREEACQTVVDFGCGDAAWIKSALLDPEMTDLLSVVGVDMSTCSLNRARRFIGVSIFNRMARKVEFLQALPSIQLYRVRFQVKSSLLRDGKPVT